MYRYSGVMSKELNNFKLENIFLSRNRKEQKMHRVVLSDGNAKFSRDASVGICVVNINATAPG